MKSSQETQRDGTRLLGLTDAAAYLSVTVRSLYRFIAQGEITPVRLPGFRRTLIDRGDLDKLIAEAKQREVERP